MEAESRLIGFIVDSPQFGWIDAQSRCTVRSPIVPHGAIGLFVWQNKLNKTRRASPRKRTPAGYSLADRESLANPKYPQADAQFPTRSAWGY